MFSAVYTCIEEPEKSHARLPGAIVKACVLKRARMRSREHSELEHSVLRCVLFELQKAAF
eukprot:CAMPEP_0177417502 /NCGR_PEP_ID=MMETSP0368-20130122/68684_1 /TAXON_ID=447022 ORGANISM="Scrippsiella hangoei-like, Strain SHHI-4" /NCGR_SAMPLE_ID=MMETSP0368 /ASSEMBLY_ACC=CAM_ASM_000363 /LENGTH=59 /DNA_ID=CAMNT_0018887087 /DNA_START=287 /DNA_END=466 /DNA_ORIENTATION=+